MIMWRTVIPIAWLIRRTMNEKRQTDGSCGYVPLADMHMDECVFMFYADRPCVGVCVCPECAQMPQKVSHSPGLNVCPDSEPWQYAHTRAKSVRKGTHRQQYIYITDISICICATQTSICPGHDISDVTRVSWAPRTHCSLLPHDTPRHNEEEVLTQTWQNTSERGISPKAKRKKHTCFFIRSKNTALKGLHCNVLCLNHI